jgi:hypothetical protein
MLSKFVENFRSHPIAAVGMATPVVVNPVVHMAFGHTPTVVWLATVVLFLVGLWSVSRDPESSRR